ncbi:MAG: purine-nucleoside phosphorylase, partial [Bacteroidota bacterium]
MLNEIIEATDYLKKHGIDQPEVGVILGTGLGNLFVKEVKNPIEINYNSIPHFPVSTVEFHKGKLIYGTVKGKKVLAMQGRFHFYEGYSMQKITLPVRVMKMLGIEELLISNAAGNLNPKWKKGEMMLIDDH